jgi:hypothetical protein
VLVAEDEAGALQEDRGDLFFTISVENRESPLYRQGGRFEEYRVGPCVFFNPESRGGGD